MMEYINVKVNISEGQKEKLQHAIKAGCSAVSIRLGHLSKIHRGIYGWGESI